jgi:MinD superfamily P-loop ATPase
MKELVVISGKGGTGKTSLTAALAYLGAPLILADCDVDAANLHLLAAPVGDSYQTEAFQSGSFAVVNEGVCTGCGACAGLCRFDAVSLTPQAGGGEVAHIDALACEGCGVCVDHCPAGAIEERPRQAGELVRCDTRFGRMVYGRLDAGQPNSGKLVALVRSQARAAAEENGAQMVLVDGPPGVGCPVIASLSGVDIAVVVVEPTVSSLHDMERVLDLCSHFKVVPAVVINKADLNPGIAGQIEEQCAGQGIAVLGSIHYDNAFVHAMIAGKTITEDAPDSRAAKEINAIWQRLQDILVPSPFDAFPGRYDAWFDSPAGKTIFTAEVACIRQLQPEMAGRWLEVGVGSGRFAESLCVQEGIDPSPAMVELAEARGISATAAVAEDLPYPEGTWDGVLLVVTICFLDDPLQALEECRRVLCKGGSLIVGLVPGDSAWGFAYANQGRQGHPFYSVARFYTCSEVISLAERAGLVLDGAASAVLHPPDGDPPVQQDPVAGIVPGAGFVAMRFRDKAKN